MGLVKTFQLIVSSISEPWNTWKFYQVSIWPYLTHFGKPKTLIKWGCFAWLFLLSIFSASPLSYVLHITFEDTESVSVNTLHTTVYHITPYYIRIEQTLLTMQSKKTCWSSFCWKKTCFACPQEDIEKPVSLCQLGQGETSVFCRSNVVRAWLAMQAISCHVFLCELDVFRQPIDVSRSHWKKWFFKTLCFLLNGTLAMSLGWLHLTLKQLGSWLWLGAVLNLILTD